LTLITHCVKIRARNKGETMIVYNEVFQTYDVIWEGIVISSTWSKEKAEALVQELQEKQD
jgi:hypothetical protein